MGSGEDDGKSPLTREEILAFREEVYRHYREHKRNFPWRETTDPYSILVSEVMLQQTGVDRVRVYYPRFIAVFPAFSFLAGAPLADVLRVWKGLGYNRRAQNLRRTACIVEEEFSGVLPPDEKILSTLPGIGRTTAAAILAFAFNLPSVLVETNIRRLFLHRFFPCRDSVPDREILPFVSATLDRENPRDWYYALMDLGSHLRSISPDPNQRSAHRQRQSRFHGSDREIRGRILAALLERTWLCVPDLAAASGADTGRVRAVCRKMEREGLIVEEGGEFRIS